MKEVAWLGDSRKTVRTFPSTVRDDLGFQLELVQRGLQAEDFKPMPAVGRGVEEIRIWDESGTYRVIYLARLQEKVYVLHAFQKKTQATSQRDVDLARARLADLLRKRPTKIL